MRKRPGITFLIGGAVGALLVLAGVDALRSAVSKPSAPTASMPATNAPKATNEPTSTPTVQDIMELSNFVLLDPGTYVIDPDGDASTPLQVRYEVPVEGWSQWIGATKFADYGHVGVSITTVTNLVRQGCRDHRPAKPPVGPSVDDLATALADLAPFKLTSPPKDVTPHGYSGKHLELTVPDLPVKRSLGERFFRGCVNGKLNSWFAPLLGVAYWGYNSEPGRTEEFWILDAEGTRLVIEASWSPDSPRQDLAEMRDILHSVRIYP